MKKYKGNSKSVSLVGVLLRSVRNIMIILIVIFLALQLYVILRGRAYFVELDDAKPADAAMVLGAMVYQNKKPSPILQDRLNQAIELYEKGLVSKILVSGDHGGRYYDEVNVMRLYLQERGIPEADIFMDHAGFNTYDSCYRAKYIFGINSMIICTQKYHAYRAVYLARKMDIDATAYPAKNKISHRYLYNQIRESLARIKAFYEAEISQRPASVMGEPIPLINGDGTVTQDQRQQTDPDEYERIIGIEKKD